MKRMKATHLTCLYVAVAALLQGSGGDRVRVGSERRDAEEGRRWVGVGRSRGGNLLRR
jgi:hypothetical protein